MHDPAVISALFGAAERAVNAALALDAGTRQRLATLQGKVIGIRVDDPGFALFLLPQSDGLLLHSVHEGPVDVTLSGPLSEFIALAGAEDKPSALINGGLAIAGNSAVLTDFQAALSGLDVDWEAPLARGLGDVPAHLLGRTLRGLFRWGRESAAGAREALADYLRDEARVVVPRAEFEEWCHEVTRLRLATDRLQARVARLLAQVKVVS